MTTLIPAIDLKDGRVVRLKQGDFDRVTEFPLDPLELARSYEAQGAKWLHLVDLDGARDGTPANLEAIRMIVENTGLNIQTGGGIREHTDVTRRLRLGVRRVVIGSIAVEQPSRLITWLDRFGSRSIVVALDVREDDGGRFWPATRGWLKTGKQDLNYLLNQLTAGGLHHLLCTDIARDGMLEGPNLMLYQSLADSYPALRIQASGGVAGLDDLKRVAALGLSGVITGKALLSGGFSLPAALEAVRV